MNKIRLLLSGLLCMLFVSIAIPSDAITLIDVQTSTGATGSSCDDYIMTMNVNYTGEVDDWNGFDLIGIAIVDGMGTEIAAHWNGRTVGSTNTDLLSFSLSSAINPMAARPLTITIYDLTVKPSIINNYSQIVFDDIIGQNAPVLGVFTHDPGILSSYCAALPLIVPQSPVVTGSSFGLDGRINPDAAAPFVAYIVAGDLQLYYPQGGLRLTVTAADIASVNCPEAGAALIKEGNGVSVYRLADCSFQVMSASLGGEKTYTLIFESLTSRNYQSFER